MNGSLKELNLKKKYKNMTKLREYFKDEEGKPSSTRLFSFYMLLFFFATNLMMLISVLYGKTIVDLNTIILIAILDMLMLTAIYVPKQLGKVEEIRKIIELARTGKISEIDFKEDKKEEEKYD